MEKIHYSYHKATTKWTRASDSSLLSVSNPPPKKVKFIVMPDSTMQNVNPINRCNDEPSLYRNQHKLKKAVHYST
jgi:hypothetical protein